MRNCERYEEMISALLDGELGEAEREELSQHLAGCERCSELCVAFAAASGAAAEGLEDPPAGLHGEIMKKVGPAAKVNRAQSQFMTLRPVIAAAACVAVVVITVLAAGVGRERSNAPLKDSSRGSAPEADLYAAAGIDGGDAYNAIDNGFGIMEVPADPAEANAYDVGRSAQESEEEDLPEAEETEPYDAAPLWELEAEAVAAGEGSFTAKVLSDPNSYFAAGSTLTVLTDEQVSPGDRVTVRYSSVGVGEETGTYYVTADEIEIADRI